MLRLAVAACVAASMIAAAHDALAEDTNRVAAATLLFDEGVKALDAGHLEEACEKLQKSQDLAPSGGTLLAIAECQERSQHFASAWVAYRAAAGRAHAAGKTEAEAGALAHAAKLEPKLAQITVTVTAPAPSLSLVRDGVAMTASEIGVAIPVDPGHHEFRASVAGSDAWSRAVDVEAGTTTTIDVPALAEPPPPPPPVRDIPAPPPRDRGKTQRILSYIAGGVGVGALAGGGVFYEVAVHDNNRSAPLCPGHECSERGIRLNNDAIHAASAATGLFIGGAVLLAGGVILYLTAPHSPNRTAFEPYLRF